MAVQGVKARVFLQCTVNSLLQHLCCSREGSSVCVATAPDLSSSRRETMTILRERGGATPANKATDRRCGVCVSGNKYIVNPSRYPPHMLQAPRKMEYRKFQRTPQKTLLTPPPTNLAMAVRLLDTILSFSTPSQSSPLTPHPEHGDDRPTPAQMAIILLKLREEMPAFFDGHHSMDLYAPDMTFENSLGSKSWTVHGSTAHSALLTTWRLGVRVCFSRPQLDLLKISKEVESGRIEARWRARGRPRAPWRTGERIIVEAFSTFQVRADGNIASHKVDKVMPGGKEPNRVMSWLARVGVALIPSPPIGVTRTSHDILPHNV